MSDAPSDISPNSVPVQHWAELPENERAKWQELLSNLILPPLVLEGGILTLGTSDSEPQDVADHLRVDPLLSAKILAVANSAAMSQIKHVTSLERAIVLLGYNLVQAIVTTYYLEYSLRNWPGYSRNHFHYVRRWSAASSVLAHNFARTMRLDDPASISTAALLSRLGSLVLGMSPHPPDQGYRSIPNEISRLRLEAATWGITSPVLSGRLARLWGLPQSTAELMERSWEPLFVLLDSERSERVPVLIASAIVLAAGFLAGSKFDARVLLGRYSNEILKANLDAHGLVDTVVAICANTRVEQELKTITA